MKHVTFDHSMIGWLIRELRGHNQCPTTAPITAKVTGRDFITYDTEYTVDNIPAGYTVTNYTWFPTEAIEMSQTQPNLPKVRFNAKGNYNGGVTISAHMHNGQCSHTTAKANIWVGKPSVPNRIYNWPRGDVFEGNTIYVLETEAIAATSYTWDMPYGWQIITGQGTYKITFRTPATTNSIQRFRIGVRGNNECGNSDYIYENGEIWPRAKDTEETEDTDGIELTLSPVPVKNVLEILLNGEQYKDLFVIQIFDSFGTEMYNAKRKLIEKTSIDLSKLDQGHYILKVSNTTGLQVTKHFLKE